jgi:hypothetical protein
VDAAILQSPLPAQRCNICVKALKFKIMVYRKKICNMFNIKIFSYRIKRQIDKLKRGSVYKLVRHAEKGA